MDLTNQLYDYLHDCAAALVGFADMSMDKNLIYPRAVSVAVPVPADIVRSLKAAPNKAYYNTYHEMNARLNRIVKSGAEYLIEKGYNAVAMTTDAVQIVRDKWISNFPHKTAATRAGLGWIGKNCLLVTRQYGGAVRLSSILTDAPLQTADAITRSECGECTLCVKCCPAEALSGTLWEAGMERSKLFNEQKSRRNIYNCYLLFCDGKEKYHSGKNIWNSEESNVCDNCCIFCPFVNNPGNDYSLELMMRG